MLTYDEFPVFWEGEDEDGNEVKYLNRYYFEAAVDACNDLLREIVGDDRSAFGMVHLQNMDTALFEKVEMGVNWCCEGKQDPARAAKVGRALQAAAIMAAHFPYTGLTINYHKDTREWTDEDREDAKLHMEYFADGVMSNMITRLREAGLAPDEG